MNDKKLISIVIPVLNEVDNVRRARDAVVEVFASMKDKYNYEIIFMDNHSTDGTLDQLRALAAENKNVKVLRFAHNFGFQRSLLTGYRAASGDVAIQLDCDLQDPPELFEEFLKLWEKGHDVVVGIRRQRQENALLTLCRKIYYKILIKVTDADLMHNGGDFRLLDKSILDQLRAIYCAEPFVRTMSSALASNQIGVPYDRRSRMHQKSKFPLRRLIRFAFDGIYSYSSVPLKLASYFGFLIAFITFGLAGFYVAVYLIEGKTWPEGFATTTLLILFGISMNAFFLGVMGEYIARIYKQALRFPITIIEESINLTIEKY